MCCSWVPVREVRGCLIFIALSDPDYWSVIICIVPDKPILSVADPDLGSGAFLPRDPDPGPRIKKVPDMGSGINILDKISESLETIFWVKNS